MSSSTPRQYGGTSGAGARSAAAGFTRNNEDDTEDLAEEFIYMKLSPQPQSSPREKQFSEFSRIIQRQVPNVELDSRTREELFKALSHPSANWSDKSIQVDFQRWEWIGDAVLNFCVSEMLFRSDLKAAEDQLSRKRMLIVRESSLAQWARMIGLADEVISIQQNTLLTDGMLADVVEALIGRAFLVSGFPTAKALVERIVAANNEQLNGRPALNPKATLQEWSVAVFGVSPKFRELRKEGPDHKPVFYSNVSIDVSNRTPITADGVGNTRQQAEEAASLKLFKPPEIIPSVHSEEMNPKGQLQEKTIRALGVNPDYQLIPEPGPANAPFIVRAGVKNWHYETGFGATRREAEIEAACKLLQYIEEHGIESGKSTYQTSFAGSSASSPSLAPPESSNPKGSLQELLQKRGWLPRYETVDRFGEDHAPVFVVEVFIGSDVTPIGRGNGRTKKKAEEQAAIQALQRLSKRLG